VKFKTNNTRKIDLSWTGPSTMHSGFSLHST
jgi:hypothetical protein